MMVNGPEGGLEWDAVDWRVHEKNVARLRQRIFTAAREQDWAKLRSLQEMTLRSWSNTLVSVRQVTQRNAGRRTAGIDGVVVLDGPSRMALAVQAHRSVASWEPLPVRRVYVPKASGKQRPLGIPVILDRVHQARVKNALEPEWEARFEPRSYGFRPGRSCQDAAGALYGVRERQGPTGVDPGRGSERGLRQNQPFLPASPARVVPRQGHDRRVADGGGVRGGQGNRAHGGRYSTGRHHQPRLAERRAARP